MKKITILLSCMCIITFLAGCLKHSTLVMLSEAPLTLSDKPTVFTPEQSLLRANRSLSIRMHLKEAWTPEPPWKDIRLQDDTVATITAVLISDIGTHYYPMVIGAGDGLDIRFNDSVPKDARIVKIVLTSTHPLTARNIMWVDWNPK